MCLSSDVCSSDPKPAYPLMAAVLLVLVFLLIPGIGAVRGGARRWVVLGGFAFQPAELAKLSLLLYLARSLAKKTDKMASFTLGVLPHLVVGGLFIGLIVLEPDLGTAVTLGLLLILMLFIAGAKLSHLVYLGLAA